jgi:hypothetical protein
MRFRSTAAETNARLAAAMGDILAYAACRHWLPRVRLVWSGSARRRRTKRKRRRRVRSRLPGAALRLPTAAYSLRSGSAGYRALLGWRRMRRGGGAARAPP